MELPHATDLTPNRPLSKYNVAIQVRMRSYDSTVAEGARNLSCFRRRCKSTQSLSYLKTTYNLIYRTKPQLHHINLADNLLSPHIARTFNRSQTLCKPYTLRNAYTSYITPHPPLKPLSSSRFSRALLPPLGEETAGDAG